MLQFQTFVVVLVLAFSPQLLMCAELGQGLVSASQVTSDVHVSWDVQMWAMKEELASRNLVGVNA
jgi:hypothetical protein